MGLSPSGEPGRCTGFDVQVDDRRRVQVRFASAEAITCAKPTVEVRAGLPVIVFDKLVAAPDIGLELAESRIEVSLPDRHFPILTVNLRVKSFDPERWRRKLGNNPFHFLTLSIPDATLLHRGGWLIPTPAADPYPMLDDVPNGSVRASAYPYNRQWTLRQPIARQIFPVIGLWAPNIRLYGGWDLLSADPDSGSRVCTACCNRLLLPSANGKIADDARGSADRQADRKGEGKFVAFVFAEGEHDSTQFDYPSGGETITTRARLVCDGDLSELSDPNSLLWHSWWDSPETASHFAAAPEIAHFADAPVDRDTVSAPLLTAEGWSDKTIDWTDCNPAELAYEKGDRQEIARLLREGALLVRTAHRFKANGDDCIYWPADASAKLVPTRTSEPPSSTQFHHSAGWATGRLLLALYRHHAKLNVLPVIRGVFAWAKHAVWQRYSGAPALTTINDEALRVAFLLDYYATFAADFDRRDQAVQALEMARTGVYRAMAMRPMDGSLPAFRWETASSTGTPAPSDVSSARAAMNVFAQAAVATGDPLLLWAMQGTAARYGRPEKESSEVALKVASDRVDMRLLVGEKAVLSTARIGVEACVASGRRSESGDLALVLRGPADPFTATITVPGADLTNRPIAIVRDRLIRIPLVPGERLSFLAGRRDAFVVKGLRGGDTLQIGNPDLGRTESLIVRPAHVQRSSAGQPLREPVQPETKPAHPTPSTIASTRR